MLAILAVETRDDIRELQTFFRFNKLHRKIKLLGRKQIAFHMFIFEVLLVANGKKKTPRETQTLRAGCSKAEPKKTPRRRPPSRGHGTAKI